VTEGSKCRKVFKTGKEQEAGAEERREGEETWGHVQKKLELRLFRGDGRCRATVIKLTMARRVRDEADLRCGLLVRWRRRGVGKDAASRQYFDHDKQRRKEGDVEVREGE
jgi:hypothetical protein